MNWYTVESLAVSHSKQNKQPDSLLRVLPTERISVHHCPSTGVRPLVIWAISSCGTPATVPGLSEPASMVLLRSFLQSVSYKGENRPSYKLFCAVYHHHLKAGSCPTPAPFWDIHQRLLSKNPPSKLICLFRAYLSLIVHITLPLDDGVLLCNPILWFGGSDNTQFMLSSSGCMVTSWPMAKHFVTKAL